MKKKLLYNIALFFCIAICGACSDFLEHPPIDVKTEPVNSIESAQATLVGAYGGLKNYYGGVAIILGDVMTDNSFGSESVTTYKAMSSWTFSASSSEAETIWTTLYSIIDNTNSIINAIDLLSGSTTLKNEIKGQAYALRALSYMELLKWFSKPYTVDKDALGVPLVFSQTDGNRNVRPAVSVCYDAVISDLLNAEKLLVTKTAVIIGTDGEDKPKAYISLWAVKGFLARAYLYMGDYVNAASYASAVINSWKYVLLTTVDGIHNQALYDKGLEIIFKVAYVETDVTGGFGAVYFKLVGQNAPDADYVPASSFLDLYSQFGPANIVKSADQDIRYKEGGYFSLQQTKRQWTAMLCYRYPGNPSLVNTAGQFHFNMPKALKLSEMYLIRAEAYANTGGKLNDALADYNYLRSHRIQSYVNETSLGETALKTEIFNERMRELCFEGHYWFDLKRAHRGFERKPTTVETAYISTVGSTLKVEADDYRWQLPIPLSEFNGNPDIPKNPGY